MAQITATGRARKSSIDTTSEDPSTTSSSGGKGVAGSPIQSTGNYEPRQP